MSCGADLNDANYSDSNGSTEKEEMGGLVLKSAESMNENITPKQNIDYIFNEMVEINLNDVNCGNLNGSTEREEMSRVVSKSAESKKENITAHKQNIE